MELKMHISMTGDTKSYQIFESVVSQSTPWIGVMHLKAF